MVYAMEVKRFTGKEVEALRGNPYTYKVIQCQLSFTTGFKELFWKYYNEGMTPKDILPSFGYDPDMLGNNRVNGIRMHIKKEFEKQGRFCSGRKQRSTPSSDNASAPADPAHEVRFRVCKVYVSNEKDT